jgi:hypothetical protein
MNPYKNYFYEIVLYDNPYGDGLLHVNIYKNNPFNLVHTTGGYLAQDDCSIIAQAIIDFMIESEYTE